MVYIILALELSYLIYLIIKKRISFNIDFKFDNLSNSKSLLKDLLFFSSILFLSVFFYFFTSNLGDIFLAHDALFSWNR